MTHFLDPEQFFFSLYQTHLQFACSNINVSLFFQEYSLALGLPSKPVTSVNYLWMPLKALCWSAAGLRPGLVGGGPKSAAFTSSLGFVPFCSSSVFSSILQEQSSWGAGLSCADADALLRASHSTKGCVIRFPLIWENWGLNLNFFCGRERNWVLGWFRDTCL